MFPEVLNIRSSCKPILASFVCLMALSPPAWLRFKASFHLCSPGSHGCSVSAGLLGLPENLTTFLSGLDQAGYFQLLRRVIVGSHAPEEVVLLEIEPYRQKTVGDFLLTGRHLGIKIACIRDVKRQGSKLMFEGVPVKRIYNRVIVDELVRKDVQGGFDFRDEVDVEWAGHPNWFFLLSKFSLPWFKHECVPETHFLSDIKDLPGNLSDYVLKRAIFLRRPRRKHRTVKRRHRRHPGPSAQSIHPSAQNGFRPHHRNAQRPHQNRSPHHVRLGFRRTRSRHHRHPFRPRQDDGR